MRYRAESLRLAVLCLALLLGVALGSTAAGATSMASAEDFAHDTDVAVATLPRVEPAGASAATAEDGSRGIARFSYDPSADVAPGTVVESTGLGSRVDQAGSAVAPTSVVSVPSPTDTKLQNYVDQLFKHANQPGRIGDGTTMAALPSELAAGAGPHIQKATEIRNGLARWLRTGAGQNASAADRAIAQDLFDQLDELLP